MNTNFRKYEAADLRSLFTVCVKGFVWDFLLKFSCRHYTSQFVLLTIYPHYQGNFETLGIN